MQVWERSLINPGPDSEADSVRCSQTAPPSSTHGPVLTFGIPSTQLEARVRALKLPEQLALEREEDEAAAAAAALAQRRDAQEAERQRRLADIRRRDAARQALQRVAAGAAGGGAAAGGGRRGKGGGSEGPVEALGEELKAEGKALLARAQRSVGPDDPVVVTLARSARGHLFPPRFVRELFPTNFLWASFPRVSWGNCFPRVSWGDCFAPGYPLQYESAAAH